MSIGQRLKKERQRLGHDQATFGAIGKKSRSSQVRYEKGQDSLTSDYLTLIEAAGADTAYIITGERLVNAEKVSDQYDAIIRSAKELNYKLTTSKLKSFLLIAIEQHLDEQGIKQLMNRF